MDGDEILRRLNRETGLVEGEEAARYVGTRIAKLAKMILGHPVVQLVVPADALREMIGDIVLLESTLHPMTQKMAYVEMCVTNGLDLRQATLIADMLGLSDTLPMTHPKSTKLTEENRKVLESMGVTQAEMDKVAEEYARGEEELDRIQGKTKEQPVELPESIEGFLRQFLKDDGGYTPEGD